MARENSTLASRLPSIDALLNSEDIQSLIEQWGRASVRDAVRQIQVNLRNEKAKSQIPSSEITSFYRQAIAQWLQSNRHPSYTRVFNVTGTLLHSNLGRAQISEELLERVKDSITRPSSLEFDLIAGTRGQREEVVCERICRLIDCEAAAVVNNNAAAVLIALNTFACDKTVVVSRGELIEIGGSFRLPEIMESAGCELIEVGTTNRTHLSDYKKAIAHDPALLLKVHPSNYRIDGFTKSVSYRELANLAKRAAVPLVVDLGSGALIDTRQFGLPKEPNPQDPLLDGVDLVTFSGDKLLGGPQCGLIVGSAELINRIEANPLKRALRTSKTTLALLDETIKAYEDPDSVVDKVHALKLLSLSSNELNRRAKRTHESLTEVLSDEFSIEIQPSEVEVGSGAMPGHTLPSVAVAISHDSNRAIENLLQTFRLAEIPVIGRIYRGKLELNMHGAEPIDEFVENLTTLE